MTPARAQRIARNLAGGSVAVVQCYVLMEIMWSVLNPSGPRLYEHGIELARKCRTRLEYRLQVISTLRSIRRLPENDA